MLDINVEFEKPELDAETRAGLRRLAEGVAKAVEPMLIEMCKNGCTIAIGRITFGQPGAPFAIAIAMGDEEVQRLAVAVDGDEIVKGRVSMDPGDPARN